MPFWSFGTRERNTKTMFKNGSNPPSQSVINKHSRLTHPQVVVIQHVLNPRWHLTALSLMQLPQMSLTATHTFSQCILNVKSRRHSTVRSLKSTGQRTPFWHLLWIMCRRTCWCVAHIQRVRDEQPCTALQISSVTEASEGQAEWGEEHVERQDRRTPSFAFSSRLDPSRAVLFHVLVSEGVSNLVWWKVSLLF